MPWLGCQTAREAISASGAYPFRSWRDGKRIMATTLTWLMQAEGAGVEASSRRIPRPMTGLNECKRNRNVYYEGRRHDEGP